MHGIPLADIHPVNTSPLAATLVSNSTKLGSDVAASIYNFNSNVSTIKTFGFSGMNFEITTAAESAYTETSINTNTYESNKWMGQYKVKMASKKYEGQTDQQRVSSNSTPPLSSMLSRKPIGVRVSLDNAGVGVCRS